MKRLLPFLAILPVFFAGTAFAAATLEIQVNGLAYANIAKFPRSAIPVIGISSTLGFTIHGGKAASPPRPPFGRDVQLTGQGTNPQPNSDQYNFFVTPLHTGTVTIPAFDIRTTAGESLHAGPITLPVQPLK